MSRFACVTINTLAFVAVFATTSISFAGALSEAQRDTRLLHAHELLGNRYEKSAVRSGEKIDKVNSMIYRWTKKALPEAYRKSSRQIAQAIIDESLKYEFDPVFVMSVITNESSFRPLTVGSAGEIGLMQIRPQTAKWIATREHIEFKGKKTLRDPIGNIKIGTAYLSYLRGKFDTHARLYLAAYNMGAGNVNEALDHKIWPKDYALRVMKYYVHFYRELREDLSTRVLASLSKKGDKLLTKARTHSTEVQSDQEIARDKLFEPSESDKEESSEN